MKFGKLELRNAQRTYFAQIFDRFVMFSLKNQSSLSPLLHFIVAVLHFKK